MFSGLLNPHNLKLGLNYIHNQVIYKIFREAGYIKKLESSFIILFESYETRDLHPPKAIEEKSKTQKIFALFESPLLWADREDPQIVP